MPRGRGVQGISLSLVIPHELAPTGIHRLLLHGTDNERYIQ